VMVALAVCAIKENYWPESELIRVGQVIAKAGLPIRHQASVDRQAVIDRLKVDKKKKDDVVHFVLIKKISLPFVNGSISDRMISNVLEEMKA